MVGVVRAHCCESAVRLSMKPHLHEISDLNFSIRTESDPEVIQKVSNLNCNTKEFRTLLGLLATEI